MRMNDGIIIIGGGTQGARTIDGEYQSFLKMDGRTCIEIVLDEATKTDNGFPIYIWGPETTLKELLSPIITREKGKREIRIVPERPSPIDSLMFAYLESFKRDEKGSRTVDVPPVSLQGGDWSAQQALATQQDTEKLMFYLPSDIPLVSHREMDFLIGNAEPGYDLLMGWSLRKGFEAVLKALQGDRKNIDLS